MNFKEEVSKIKTLIRRPEFEYSQVDSGRLIDELRKSVRPDEMAYLIDCKTSDVLTIKESRMFPNIKDNSNLYEDIKGSFMEEVLDYTQKIISAYNEIENFHTETRATQYYKNANGDVILKTTFAPLVENGKVRFTAGILKNLYNDVKLNNLTYRYDGPTAHILYDRVNRVDRHNKLLSGREIQILKMIRDGYKNRQIAMILSISEHTARTHRRNIISKLGVSGSFKAVQKAEENGMLY